MGRSARGRARRRLVRRHLMSRMTAVISGTGQNKKNYFDRSGAYGAYYPGSFTQALGWSSSGNIDMNTGAIITPA